MRVETNGIVVEVARRHVVVNHSEIVDNSASETRAKIANKTSRANRQKANNSLQTRKRKAVVIASVPAGAVDPIKDVPSSAILSRRARTQVQNRHRRANSPTSNPRQRLGHRVQLLTISGMSRDPNQSLQDPSQLPGNKKMNQTATLNPPGKVAGVRKARGCNKLKPDQKIEIKKAA